MSENNKSVRERVMEILSGCPGCGIPYGVTFPIYEDSGSGRSVRYEDYLECRVCMSWQLRFVPSDRFILDPPRK